MNPGERFDKIDDAIQRLAVVASDLSKMLAVHEHRIGQQEKTYENIVTSMEKRRTEIDTTLKDVYHTIKEENNALKEYFTKENSAQNTKIDYLEKRFYMALGAITIIGLFASHIIKILFNIPS
jgi:DNA-binding cell septation regulator SpoVG